MKKVFAEFSSEIKSVTTLQKDNEIFFCVTTDKVYVLSEIGETVITIYIKTEHASAFFDGKENWLVYDSKMRMMNSDMIDFIRDEIKIESIPLFAVLIINLFSTQFFSYQLNVLKLSFILDISASLNR